MRLSLIVENMTRRDFLKSTAGSVMSGNLLNKMLSLGIKTTPGIIAGALSNELAEKFADIEMKIDDNYGPIKFSNDQEKRQFTAYFINKLNTEYDVIQKLRSQGAAEYKNSNAYDFYTDGAFSKIANSMLGDKSPQYIVGLIKQIASNDEYDALVSIYKCSNILKSFGKIISPMTALNACEDEELGLKLLYKLGYINRNAALQGIEEKQRYDRDKKSYENWENQQKQANKNIKFKPRHDDHIYGSSMHQSFENKLKNALTII